MLTFQQLAWQPAQPVVELLMGAAIALVIIYGGAQAIAGKLLLGSFVALSFMPRTFLTLSVI